MKKYYLFITFTFIEFVLFSQVDSKIIYNILTKTQLELINNINHEKGKYVSNLSFRKIIKNDFASLTQADNMSSNVGSYASLDINSTDKTFQFSPFIISSDINQKPFKNLFSLDISGTLNGKGVFSKENKYSLKSGFSWVHILKEGYIPKSCGYSETKTKAIYEEVAKKIINQSLLDNCSYGSIDSQKIINTYLNTILDEEIKMSESKWASKKVTWVKLSALPLSYDILDYYEASDSSSIYNPSTMNVYNPSMTFSLNHVSKSKKLTLFVNAWGKWSIKNTFSEIHSTEQWRKVNKINDSIYIEQESLDLYKLPINGFSKLGIFDAGIQFITIWNSEKINIGLDLKFTNLGFITPDTKNGISRINQILVGVIFPFKDKEGNASINIELFYQHSEYNNFDAGSKSTLGVRFGVPINNLF